MRRSEIHGVVFEATAILSFAAALIGVWQLRLAGKTGWSELAIGLAIPSTTALLFLGACYLFPSLVMPGRLVRPLNWTLPIAYLGLLLASIALWSTSGGSLTALPEAMRPMNVWSKPITLLATWVVQCAMLSIVASWRKEPV